MELKPILITAEIVRRHIEADRLVEAVAPRIPNVGCPEIAPQQAHDVNEDNGAGIELRPQPFETRDDVAEEAQLAVTDVANNGTHTVRPAAAAPVGRLADEKLFLRSGKRVKTRK